MEKIKTIFIGTPDFAVPSLNALVNDERFEVVGVITQPDKKVGKKQILTPTPVKVFAETHNIKVYQPEKISEFRIQNSEFFNVDLIIVIAYAQLIPEAILNAPKHGCINVHGSLLPKYRGASCVQAAIKNGDGETGVTIMKMDRGLDTGPIIFQENIKIENNDTYGSLYIKLSELGGKIVCDSIFKFIQGEIKEKEQDNSLSSYVPMLKKEDGKINWSKNAEEVERFIRSRQTWPSAFSAISNDEFRMTKIKIIETEHELVNSSDKKIGEMFIFENKLAVQCGKNALIIKKLQLEGKNIISSEDFIRGHKGLVGSILQ